jgi:hypothetical protein
MDFIKQHVDKLLLSLLFLICFGIFIHFTRQLFFFATPANATHLGNEINWLENIVSQILAALLTLMVGRSVSATATTTPGGATTVTTGPTAPTVITPTVIQPSAAPVVEPEKPKQ